MRRCRQRGLARRGRNRDRPADADARPVADPTPTANITAAQFAATTTVNGVSITADEQLAIVNAGTNNNVNGTGGALNGIYPTSSTSLVTATDPSTLNSFFTSTNYVGALNGPSDTAFQGWTCNSTSAEFGGSGRALHRGALHRHLFGIDLGLPDRHDR